MSSFLHPPLHNFKDIFRFDHSQIELSVEQREELYPGTSLEALYTSLDDLYHIQTHPRVLGSWCDLGAGVGLSALLYGSLFPDRKAIGIELATSRWQAGITEKSRLGLSNVELLNHSLLDGPIPPCQTYFLYFPTGPVLDRILDELANADDFLLVAIESHGDLFARLEQEPTLKLVDSLKLQSPRHHPEARFYQKMTSNVKKDPLFSLSYQERYLLIRDGQGWWGESHGMEWIGDDKFNLKYPPRTIARSEIEEVKSRHEIHQDLVNLCQLRRRGELKLETSQGVILASIRKISAQGGFSLELSTGDWLEWKEIKSIHWNHHLCFDASSSSFFLPPVH